MISPAKECEKCIDEQSHESSTKLDVKKNVMCSGSRQKPVNFLVKYLCVVLDKPHRCRWDSIGAYIKLSFTFCQF